MVNSHHGRGSQHRADGVQYAIVVLGWLAILWKGDLDAGQGRRRWEAGEEAGEEASRRGRWRPRTSVAQDGSERLSPVVKAGVPHSAAEAAQWGRKR